MKETVLTIGMPAGSLADPNRGGNLISLLERSGYKTSGYEKGGPSKFSNTNFLYGWDGRPQEFSSQLGVNEIDIAIAGDDWIKERVLELELEYDTNIKLEKVLSLNRGNVRIVGIIDECYPQNNAEDFIKDVLSKKDIIVVVSEMPYLALDWINSKLKNLNLYDNYKDFSVQKYKTPSKIKKGILIYETWGKTEAKIKNGGADIGLEITQTGSALKNYKLKIIDEVMQSETGIWINPIIKQDFDKKELLDMFLLNLYGAISAESKVLIAFNVPNIDSQEIEKYMSENNLYADEPTVSVGKNFTVYNIQVDTSNKELPIARVRYELAKRNAKNINTIPLTSSIHGLL